VPVFEVLDSAGLDVIVANARETRSVPGRKSDINDAQWLQRLPEQPIAKIRNRTKPPNAVNFDVRTALYQLIGVDLTQLHGIGPC
jgi:transposase